MYRKPARFSHEISEFPVIFPINQPIEMENGLLISDFPSYKPPFSSGIFQPCLMKSDGNTGKFEVSCVARWKKRWTFTVVRPGRWWPWLLFLGPGCAWNSSISGLLRSAATSRAESSSTSRLRTWRGKFPMARQVWRHRRSLRFACRRRRMARCLRDQMEARYPDVLHPTSAPFWDACSRGRHDSVCLHPMWMPGS